MTLTEPSAFFPCLVDGASGEDPEVQGCVAQRMNLDAIFDSVGEAMMTIGADGAITSANGRLGEMSGTPPSELIGTPASEALAREIPSFGQIVAGVFASRRSVRELCVECPGNGSGEGPRTYVITVDFLFRHADPLRQGGLLAVIRDTSELHKLRRESVQRVQFQRLVGRDGRMQEIYELIENVAPTDATTLILGESGTGKELVARSIHALSGRSDKPFVMVNCAALSEHLLESELFGHVRGSFTGAIRDRVGRFELARGGTILLDEIGDVVPSVQVKLLRVLQERVIERVGDSTPKPVDVRVIAATHQDLGDLINRGRFREDLYYRLKVLTITVPPLRERRGDIPSLVDHFIIKYNKTYGRRIEGLTSQSLALLMNVVWRGNVRELENAIEHAFVLCKQGFIEPRHLPSELQAEAAPPLEISASPEDVATEVPGDEAGRIRVALQLSGGRLGRAAERLGMHRTTLWRKMRQHGVQLEE